LPAVKAEREGVHLWPELPNLEVTGKKLTYMFDFSRAGFCLVNEKWAVA